MAWDLSGHLYGVQSVLKIKELHDGLITNPPPGALGSTVSATSRGSKLARAYYRARTMVCRRRRLLCSTWSSSAVRPRSIVMPRWQLGASPSSAQWSSCLTTMRLGSLRRCSKPRPDSVPASASAFLLRRSTPPASSSPWTNIIASSIGATTRRTMCTGRRTRHAQKRSALRSESLSTSRSSEVMRRSAYPACGSRGPTRSTL
mmetsp:Transcript_50883/g.108691  ORF Transcript_50883/g.108691 Transcript_50883/m.108691 type:complete len:203 (-) Transcript_50883:374-982(-)